MRTVPVYSRAVQAEMFTEIKDGGRQSVDQVHWTKRLPGDWGFYT